MASVNVVFVDEDDVARMCLKRLMRGLDCELTTCSCPIDCLDIVATQRPQLLIVDARMPRMSGIEFIEECTARWGLEGCQVYLCSSIVLSEDISGRANAVGAKAALKDHIFNKKWLKTAIEHYHLP